MATLLEMDNANYEIFEIPPEEGGVEDDNYLGSIGDATQKHISSLSDSERQAWEDLYHSPDGSIFRVVPNWQQKDTDPLNLQGKELDKYFLELVEKGVSEEQLEKVKILLEEEAERREQSKDIMDNSAQIPYHEWEKFPQMWKHYEIPAAPKDRYIYMGNTRQNFYDYFPEGSSSADALNIFIHMVNTDDIYVESYHANIYKWIHRQAFANPHTLTFMARVLDLILGSNPISPQEALTKGFEWLDQQEIVKYRWHANQKAEKDGMLKLLRSNAEEWEKQHKQGHHVFSDILKFGETLFKSFRGSMNAYHWHVYRRTRDKYAPAVIVEGVDINRCRLRELQKALSLTESRAKDVWHARPFRGLAEAYNKGYIIPENFITSEKTEEIIVWLEKQYQHSLQARSLAYLTRAAQKMTQAEKDNKLEIQQDDWKKLWSFFNILKQNLQRDLAKQRKQHERS